MEGLSGGAIRTCLVSALLSFIRRSSFILLATAIFQLSNQFPVDEIMHRPTFFLISGQFQLDVRYDVGKKDKLNFHLWRL